MKTKRENQVKKVAAFEQQFLQSYAAHKLAVARWQKKSCGTKKRQTIIEMMEAAQIDHVWIHQPQKNFSSVKNNGIFLQRAYSTIMRKKVASTTSFFACNLLDIES